MAVKVVSLECRCRAGCSRSGSATCLRKVHPRLIYMIAYAIRYRISHSIEVCEISLCQQLLLDTPAASLGSTQL